MRQIPGLALSLLFAGALMAQTSQIEGVVKGPDGQPLKDAQIKIERKDIKGSYKVKTRKKGDYLHAGLPLGTYRVSVEVDGKEADFVDNVRTRLGEPTKIDFDLAARAQQQQAMQQAAQTGQLTEEQERSMSKEQKEALEKAMKQRQAQIAKNKELNDAFNVGMEALKTKNFDAAVAAFQKAGELDPKQHVIWGNLADTYYGLAKTKTGAEQTAAVDNAVINYNKAIEAVPATEPQVIADYRNNLALAYALAKKYPEMEAEIAKIAQANPAGAGRAYFNLGAVLTNAGNTEGACSAFQKALETDPNYADAHYQYGICLTSKAVAQPDGSLKFPEGTEQAFAKYLELKPDGPHADSAKGMLATMGSKIETTYTAPGAKKQPARKK
jgi:tetratricopeptide (TPR) repeat protein